VRRSLDDVRGLPRPSTAELVDLVPWSALKLKPAGGPMLLEGFALGRMRISTVLQGYWQYISRKNVVIEVDGIAMCLDAPSAAEEVPRVIESLTGIAQNGERVDLDAVMLEAIRDPLAVVALDLFTRFEIGGTDTTLATHRPLQTAVGWSGSLTASYEQTAITTKRWNVPGSTGWRQVVAAVRLQATDDAWRFERIPLEVTGDEGMALS